MQRQSCYLCAAKLERKSETSWWCPACKYTQYENAKPGVELLLYKDGKFLISQRGIEPRKGSFDMPGGFVELEESLEQALFREAGEELGIESEDISKPVYLWSFNNTYPFGPEVYHCVVSVFFAELTSEKVLEAHDDVANLRWITAQEAETIDWSSPAYKESIIRAKQFLPAAAKK